MKIPLRQMIRAKSPGRRRAVELRPIQPTATQAADLYREVYAPIVKAWEAALNPILAEYERSLPSPVIRDSVPDMEAAIDGAGDFLTRLILRLVPNLREWSLRQERWQRRKWAGQVLTATGIEIDTMLSLGDVSETVEAFVARNVALMKDVSAQAQGRISEIVFRNFTEIRPVREVAKELREGVGMSKRRARNIAQDQTSKLSAALDQARQEQAGGEKFKWTHSRKLHPRKEHQARDGKVYEWTDPAIVDDKPGYAPFCGCRAAFVLDLD